MEREAMARATVDDANRGGGSTPGESTPAGDGASQGDAPRPSAALRRATGRDRAEWFAALDAWHAGRRKYREIADWLTGTHGLSDWWAQKLIVEYEQARGLRAPGIRPDGTFQVGASKVVGVPVARLFRAFADEEVREAWLPGAPLHVRSSRASRSIRFDWRDGGGVIAVFATVRTGRSQVGVRQEGLPDADAARKAKAFWRERMEALKALLEA